MIKKIYFILPLFMLSLFTFGCSSSGGGSSSNTDTNNTSITKPENNETANVNNGDNNPDENLENNNKPDANNTSDKSEENTTQEVEPLNCPIGEKPNSDNSECIADEDAKVLNGTVRDGLISGATITACKIVENNKTEANATCSTTDENGSFKCAVYEDDFDYLIFKASGGTDLGENLTDSRDDRSNPDTLTTIISKSDIEDNKTTTFVSPVTTLVVLKAIDTNWSVSEAISSIATSLNLTADALFDDSKSLEATRLVANLIDISTFSRDEVYSKLSNLETISKESINELLPDTLETTSKDSIANLIEKSSTSPSDSVEKSIDIIANKIANNETVSDVIVENVTQAVDYKYNLSSETLQVVSALETTDIEINSLVDNVEKIVANVDNKDEAVQFMIENIDNIENITLEYVQEQFETDTTEVTETVQAIKDIVNSPDDIPALPNDNARIISEGTFPSMPTDSNFLTTSDDNLTTLETPTDTVPDFEAESSAQEQVTPFEAE